MAKAPKPPMSKAQRLILILSVLALTLFASSVFFKKQVKQIDSRPILESQYQKLLSTTWGNLDIKEENTLIAIAKLKDQGGATIDDIVYLAYGQKIVEVLMNKRLAIWNTQVQKYQITELGYAVYETGMKIKAERAKIDAQRIKL